MNAEFLDCKSMAFKAGKYYVGDPCYVYWHDDNNKWRDDICSNLFNKEGTAFGNDHNGVRFYDDAGEFFVAGTAFGDGIYELRGFNGVCMGECGVDAGLLSVIPMSLVENWGGADEAGKLGVVIDMKNDFKVDADAGDLTIGDFLLSTSGSSDDEEDDEDNDYENGFES